MFAILIDSVLQYLRRKALLDDRDGSARGPSCTTAGIFCGQDAKIAFAQFPAVHTRMATLVPVSSHAEAKPHPHEAPRPPAEVALGDT